MHFYCEKLLVAMKLGLGGLVDPLGLNM